LHTVKLIIEPALRPHLFVQLLHCSNSSLLLGL
jgi:hypothetical protein